MVNKAQIRATEKYEKKSYDKILVRVPKGMKDKIKKRFGEIKKFKTISIEDLLSNLIFNDSDLNSIAKEDKNSFLASELKIHLW